MNSRITLVTLFNEESLKKMDELISSVDEKLCKVPFNRNVNRCEVDTLPFHLTLSAWDINKKDEVVLMLNSINFNSFKLVVNGLGIMNGKEGSHVLYFNIVDCDELKALHKAIYSSIPNERYNPDNFKFHITIHIDQDYEKILRIKNALEEGFTPFELEVNSIGLFSIYPAILIKEIK